MSLFGDRKKAAAERAGGADRDAVAKIGDVEQASSSSLGQLVDHDRNCPPRVLLLRSVEASV
jgi:hypothetical protein